MEKKEFFCTANEVVEAENEEAARIEMNRKMDKHDIDWDFEELS